MAFQVTLAGQDITLHTDQMSIDAVDALGQGSGAGSSSLPQGRQSTIKFDTDLGPVASAYGAGQSLPGGGPYLVRQGEIKMFNASGKQMWGGYATKYTDITTTKHGNSLQVFTTVEGTDYDAALDRIIVNQSFVAQTDVQIIKSVLSTYAPWICQTYLPALGVYTFPVKNFRNVSVQSVIRTIAGITGFMVWVDFGKCLHYVPSSAAQTAAFSLSDQPDFIQSFPHNIQEFYVDDTSAINRVTFYGGRRNSGDFTQDVSPLANGNNTVFPTAYYPHVTSDGSFHVTVNGVQQVIGYATGAQNPANTLKINGGLADCLINPDAHTVTFGTAPATGTTVLLKYQYDYPMSVVVTDQTSFTYFGQYFDGYINDDTVFDYQTAIQRCKVVLSQQSFGQTSLKIDCWQPGLYSGQSIKVKNAVRGLNATYLIQEVETEPLGGGNFVYHLTMGAWNWNLLDIVTKLAATQAVSDPQSLADAQTNLAPLLVNQLNVHINVHSSFARLPNTRAWTGRAFMAPAPFRGNGPYYARASALHDGHDAYCGFSTVSS